MKKKQLIIMPRTNIPRMKFIYPCLFGNIFEAFFSVKIITNTSPIFLNNISVTDNAVLLNKPILKVK
jgi:hypothetical protein